MPTRAALQMTVDENDVHNISAPYDDKNGWYAMLSIAFGSYSDGWINEAAGHLMSAAKPRGQPLTQDKVNAALAFVDAIRPENEFVSALTIQMFATHDLAVEMLNRAKHSDGRNATTEYTNLATKLSRTFTAQMEALAKLRRGGEQIVKHVHVYEGGQAVVAGTINQGGGGNRKAGVQPYGTNAAAGGDALPGPDQTQDLVPIPCDAERALSPARGALAGGSEGEQEQAGPRSAVG